MREADDRCFGRGSVHVDPLEALSESGDLVGPLASGIIERSEIETLGNLCSGHSRGRQSGGEITIFKSVGTALADLAAASLAFMQIRDGQGGHG